MLETAAAAFYGSNLFICLRMFEFRTPSLSPRRVGGMSVDGVVVDFIKFNSVNDLTPSPSRRVGGFVVVIYLYLP